MGVLDAIFDDLHRMRDKVRVEKDRRFFTKKMRVFESAKNSIFRRISNMFRTTFRLAGVTVEGAQENIKKFGCEDIGSFALVREPDNPHDPNAIRVALGGSYLGYVPRDIAKDLAPQMDAGRRLIALFVNRNEHPFHDTVGLTVKIVEYPFQAAA